MLWWLDDDILTVVKLDETTRKLDVRDLKLLMLFLLSYYNY